MQGWRRKGKDDGCGNERGGEWKKPRGGKRTDWMAHCLCSLPKFRVYSSAAYDGFCCCWQRMISNDMMYRFNRFRQLIFRSAKNDVTWRYIVSAAHAYIISCNPVLDWSLGLYVIIIFWLITSQSASAAFGQSDSTSSVKIKIRFKNLVKSVLRDNLEIGHVLPALVISLLAFKPGLHAAAISNCLFVCLSVCRCRKRPPSVSQMFPS